MSDQITQIESLLFYLNEEVSKQRLAEMIGCTMPVLAEHLQQLQADRAESGIVVVETPTTVTLGTHPDSAPLIDAVRASETTSPLSKAALETLSIVLYMAPVSRPEIDTVRGVNSLYSLRNLLVRGLISRRALDGGTVYEPTTDVLQLLGISNQSQLPDYQSVLDQIDQLVQGQSPNDNEVVQDITATTQSSLDNNNNT